MKNILNESLSNKDIDNIVNDLVNSLNASMDPHENYRKYPFLPFPPLIPYNLPSDTSGDGGDGDGGGGGSRGSGKGGIGNDGTFTNKSEQEVDTSDLMDRLGKETSVLRRVLGGKSDHVITKSEGVEIAKKSGRGDYNYNDVDFNNPDATINDTTMPDKMKQDVMNKVQQGAAIREQQKNKNNNGVDQKAVKDWGGAQNSRLAFAKSAIINWRKALKDFIESKRITKGEVGFRKKIISYNGMYMRDERKIRTKGGGKGVIYVDVSGSVCGTERLLSQMIKEVKTIAKSSGLNQLDIYLFQDSVSNDRCRVKTNEIDDDWTFPNGNYGGGTGYSCIYESIYNEYIDSNEYKDIDVFLVITDTDLCYCGAEGIVDAGDEVYEGIEKIAKKLVYLVFGVGLYGATRDILMDNVFPMSNILPIYGNIFTEIEGAADELDNFLTTPQDNTYNTNISYNRNMNNSEFDSNINFLSIKDDEDNEDDNEELDMYTSDDDNTEDNTYINIKDDNEEDDEYIDIEDNIEDEEDEDDNIYNDSDDEIYINDKIDENKKTFTRYMKHYKSSPDISNKFYESMKYKLLNKINEGGLFDDIFDDLDDIENMVVNPEDDINIDNIISDKAVEQGNTDFLDKDNIVEFMSIYFPDMKEVPDQTAFMDSAKPCYRINVALDNSIDIKMVGSATTDSRLVFNKRGTDGTYLISGMKKYNVKFNAVYGSVQINLYGIKSKDDSTVIDGKRYVTLPDGFPNKILSFVDFKNDCTTGGMLIIKDFSGIFNPFVNMPKVISNRLMISILNENDYITLNKIEELRRQIFTDVKCTSIIPSRKVIINIDNDYEDDYKDKIKNITESRALRGYNYYLRLFEDFKSEKLTTLFNKNIKMGNKAAVDIIRNKLDMIWSEVEDRSVQVFTDYTDVTSKVLNGEKSVANGLYGLLVCTDINDIITAAYIKGNADIPLYVSEDITEELPKRFEFVSRGKELLKNICGIGMYTKPDGISTKNLLKQSITVYQMFPVKNSNDYIDVPVYSIDEIPTGKSIDNVPVYEIYNSDHSGYNYLDLENGELDNIEEYGSLGVYNENGNFIPRSPIIQSAKGSNGTISLNIEDIKKELKNNPGAVKIVTYNKKYNKNLYEYKFKIKCDLTYKLDLPDIFNYAKNDQVTTLERFLSTIAFYFLSYLYTETYNVQHDSSTYDRKYNMDMIENNKFGIPADLDYPELLESICNSLGFVMDPDPSEQNKYKTKDGTETGCIMYRYNGSKKKDESIAFIDNNNKYNTYRFIKLVSKHNIPVENMFNPEVLAYIVMLANFRTTGGFDTSKEPDGYNKYRDKKYAKDRDDAGRRIKRNKFDTFFDDDLADGLFTRDDVKKSYDLIDNYALRKGDIKKSSYYRLNDFIKTGSGSGLEMLSVTDFNNIDIDSIYDICDAMKKVNIKTSLLNNLQLNFYEPTINNTDAIHNTGEDVKRFGQLFLVPELVSKVYWVKAGKDVVSKLNKLNLISFADKIDNGENIMDDPDLSNKLSDPKMKSILSSDEKLNDYMNITLQGMASQYRRQGRMKGNVVLSNKDKHNILQRLQIIVAANAFVDNKAGLDRFINWLVSNCDVRNEGIFPENIWIDKPNASSKANGFEGRISVYNEKGELERKPVSLFELLIIAFDQAGLVNLYDNSAGRFIYAYIMRAYTKVQKGNNFTSPFTKDLDIKKLFVNIRMLRRNALKVNDLMIKLNDIKSDPRIDEVIAFLRTGELKPSDIIKEMSGFNSLLSRNERCIPAFINDFSNSLSNINDKILKDAKVYPEKQEIYKMADTISSTYMIEFISNCVFIYKSLRTLLKTVENGTITESIFDDCISDITESLDELKSLYKEFKPIYTTYMEKSFSDNN